MMIYMIKVYERFYGGIFPETLIRTHRTNSFQEFEFFMEKAKQEGYDAIVMEVPDDFEIPSLS